MAKTPTAALRATLRKLYSHCGLRNLARSWARRSLQPLFLCYRPCSNYSRKDARRPTPLLGRGSANIKISH